MSSSAHHSTLSLSKAPPASGLSRQSEYSFGNHGLSTPEQHGGKSVPTHRENNARNMRGKNARPLAYTITQRELYQRSANAFREYAGDGPGAASKIADALECSKKTAQNYLDGRNTPGGILDLRAFHAIPHYAAMKRELSAMEAAIDPRLQAKLVEFHRAMAMYGDKLFGDEP